MVKFIRSLLLSCPYGKRLYTALCLKREELRKIRDRKILQKHGPALLQLVHDRLSGKIDYFLDYGSLLGYVREGAFLKHDDDVDFGVMPGVNPQDIIKAFQGSELEYFGAYAYNGVIREIGYKFRKMRVDFFLNGKDGNDFTADAYYTIDGQTYGPNEATCFRFIRPAVKGIKTVEFLGATTEVPLNPDDLLAAHYGPHWRNPDPNWKADDGSGHYHRIQMPGVGRFSIPMEEVMGEGK